jgi:excisionase family DNA binding protein
MTHVQNFALLSPIEREYRAPVAEPRQDLFWFSQFLINLIRSFPSFFCAFSCNALFSKHCISSRAAAFSNFTGRAACEIRIRNLYKKCEGRIMSAENNGVKLWSVNEAAAFLNISVGTLYHWVSQKRIPCLRLGSRCLRFDPETIRRWASDYLQESSPLHHL